jgi:hypothetical protein
MSSLPKFHNIAPHLNLVVVCLIDKIDFLPYHVTLYFSYETCVAYHVEGKGLTLSDNVWSTTTGKHLGMIAGLFNVNRKDKTINNDLFTSRLNQLFD